jgi:hypothetical protein
MIPPLSGIMYDEANGNHLWTDLIMVMVELETVHAFQRHFCKPPFWLLKSIILFAETNQV